LLVPPAPSESDTGVQACGICASRRRILADAVDGHANEQRFACDCHMGFPTHCEDSETGNFITSGRPNAASLSSSVLAGDLQQGRPLFFARRTASLVQSSSLIEMLRNCTSAGGLFHWPSRCEP